MGGQAFFFGQDLDFDGVHRGSLIGRLTGDGEREHVLRLTGEQLTGDTLLEHDLTAGGLLTGALMLDLQLFTLTLQVLSLLGVVTQLIGLQDTRLGGEWQLLGGETRLPLRLWSRILL